MDLNVKIAVQGEPKNIGEYDYVILEQTSDNPNYIGKISESSVNLGSKNILQKKNIYLMMKHIIQIMQN